MVHRKDKNMAETKRGRKPNTAKKVEDEKTVEVEKVVSTEDVLAEAKAENKALQEQLAQMKDMMAQLQLQINSQSQIAQPQVVIQQQSNATRTVKVISLIDNTYIMSTKPLGQGTVYRFDKYGDFKNVKFQDLQDILAINSKQFENGMAVLASKEDYDDLQIGYMYDMVLDKDRMDDVIKLQSDADVDIILGMAKEMQEKVYSIIAGKIADGVSYDFNKIKRLEKEGTGDIQEFIKMKEEMKEVEEDAE